MANCFSVIWRECLWTNDKLHNDILMKRIFIKLFQGLLALLGIAVATSCDGILGGMACAYGTPTMDYTVQGKVVNLKAEPLKGIKIKPRWDNWPPDSTFTDAQGAFVVARNGGWLEWKSDGFYYAPMIVEDTSGIYRTDTVYIKMEQIKEGDNWYKGEFEAKDAKITMLK